MDKMYNSTVDGNESLTAGIDLDMVKSEYEALEKVNDFRVLETSARRPNLDRQPEKWRRRGWGVYRVLTILAANENFLKSQWVRSSSAKSKG